MFHNSSRASRGGGGGRGYGSSTSTSTSPTTRTTSVSRPRNAHADASPRGFFTNGAWHCECSPRLPAEHFRVKKESKNKGRWFYTCQKAAEQRCGFFLWDDEAKTREETAVLAGSRTEVLRQSVDKPATGMDLNGRAREEVSAEQGSAKKRKLPWLENGEDAARSEARTAKALTEEQPAALGRARGKAPRVEINLVDTEDRDSDDTFGEPVDADVLSQVIDAMSSPSTPRKVMKTSAFDTPRAHTMRSGLVTPGTTPHTTNIIDVPRVEPQTPTPQRTQAASTTPAPVTPQKDELTREVFTFLRARKVAMDANTTSDLRTILQRHEMKSQGLAKGRDLARAILTKRDEEVKKRDEEVKKKDAEVQRLLKRFSVLEGIVESSKALITHLRSSTRAPVDLVPVPE